MATDQHEYNVAKRVQQLNETEYKTLQGKTFDVSGTFTGVSDGATRYVHIQTDSKAVALRISANSTGSLITKLYEDQGSMDVTTDGTDKTPKALNRANSVSLSSNLAFNEGPTVNNTGTAIFREVGGGSTGGDGPNDSAPGVAEPTFVILAPDTEYLLELNDTTSDSNPDDIGYSIGLHESKYDF